MATMPAPKPRRLPEKKPNMPKKIPTSADVDTEEDPRFVPWEEAKKYLPKNQIEQHEKSVARIRRIVMKTQRERLLADPSLIVKYLRPRREIRIAEPPKEES